MRLVQQVRLDRLDHDEPRRVGRLVTAAIVIGLDQPVGRDHLVGESLQRDLARQIGDAHATRAEPGEQFERSHHTRVRIGVQRLHRRSRIPTLSSRSSPATPAHPVYGL
ncbi:hypothetical protein ACR6C2_14050 [Streptomyces sp. INA 01156]